MRKWILVLFILCVLPGLVHSQALDRKHLALYSPLDYGNDCTTATLNAAITAWQNDGSPYAQLLIPATDRSKTACTWQVTSDLAVPFKLQLVVPLGSKINVSAGIVLTLTACPELAGTGWLTVGSTASKVKITAGNCPIPVAKLATAGSGSSVSKYSGWDTVIDWSLSDKHYDLGPGEYTFSTGIVISGQHISFLGHGIALSKLTWTGTTGIGLLFQVPSDSANEHNIGDFYMTCSSTASSKTAIKVVDLRGSYLHDIWVQSCYGPGATGGSSVGLNIAGRDTSAFARLTLDADRPIYITEDPNLSFVGLDTSTFQDIYIGQLVSSTPGVYPCFEVADRANISRLRFEGFNSFNRCKHGFYWDDTSTTGFFGSGLKICNFNWEQNTDPTGWLVYIRHQNASGAIQQLELCNIFGGQYGNGVFLQGMQGIVKVDNVWWTGGINNPNNEGVGLKVQASEGVLSALYQSGGSFTGSAGQTCSCTSWNTCTGTVGLLALTSTNTVAAGTLVQATTPGSNCTQVPTTCTLGNGTATCSGTATVTATLAGHSVFQGLDITASQLDGDSTFNSTGLDPCTGSAGAATGTHACVLGMTKMLAFLTGYGDIGNTAWYRSNSTFYGLPRVSFMGQVLQLPEAGSSPPTVFSTTGTLGAGLEKVAFLTQLDCPTGLAPCSGTFKLAKLSIAITGVSDRTVREAGELVILPVVGPNSPANNNEVACSACTPKLVANNPGITGKFWVYHAEGIPSGTPEGFFTLHNDLGVSVNWEATLTIYY